jgi:integrase
MDENLRYFISKPTKTRKTFVLVCYTLEGRKTRKYQKLDDTTKKHVDVVNRQFKSQVITDAEAHVLLNEIIEKLYRKANVRNMVLKQSKLSVVNQKIFNEFWDKVYSTRILSDEKSPRYDILKALRLIEPLSLATASAKEIQAALKKNCPNANVHRRAVDRINQLVAFLRRDFKINKPPKGIRIVQYLNKSDFDAMLVNITDQDLKDLAVTLFGSGLRLSEALALTENDFTGGKLNINKQLSKDGTLKLPKRGKVGRSLVLPFAIEAVKRWVMVTNKEQYRTTLFDVLADACLKTFPKDKSKWIGPHDLRHSHAIYLLGKGASLTQVALNLRNRVDVCQEYYTGFAHTDETLEALKNII